MEERISMYSGKFTSSIHNRTLILFLKSRLQDWRDSFYHWFWIFPVSQLPIFLGMKDCFWNNPLWHDICFMCLYLYLSHKKWSEPRTFKRACLYSWQSTGCKPEREGAAHLLLKQRLQWGAANQAGLRDDGKNLGGQAEYPASQEDSWLRLKWFSNHTDTENNWGNAISISFLFCMIQLLWIFYFKSVLVYNAINSDFYEFCVAVFLGSFLQREPCTCTSKLWLTKALSHSAYVAIFLSFITLFYLF